jgi:cytochrome c2
LHQFIPCLPVNEGGWLSAMRVSKSRNFFLFLLDKNSTKKQIQNILVNAADIHIYSIIEICYNLLENNYINIPPSLKSIIKKYKPTIEKFTYSSTKTLTPQRKILRKHYKLFFFLINKSKTFIIKLLSS